MQYEDDDADDVNDDHEREERARAPHHFRLLVNETDERRKMCPVECHGLLGEEPRVKNFRHLQRRQDAELRVKKCAIRAHGQTQRNERQVGKETHHFLPIVRIGRLPISIIECCDDQNTFKKLSL